MNSQERNGNHKVKFNNTNMNKNQIKRPPLGLRPKWAAQQERYFEVCGAISRYYNAGKKIPLEWIEEYNELIEFNTKDNCL